MNVSIASGISHLRWFPSLLAGIALSCAASLGAESVKPNIVFVLADDLGWGDLSCHGSEFIRTPHIDRLAREGADFYQFYTTSPVCSPSRVSFLTGQFPGRFSIHSALDPFRFAAGARRPPWLEARLRQADWLDPQATSLPWQLQQVGYVTGLFGKWHLRSAQASDAPGPTAYGLDEYALFRARNEEAPPGKTVTRETVWDASLEFIRRHRDRPFFVNVWIHEPHLAHFPSEESLKANAHLDQQRQVYAAVVTDADRGVGRILEVLDELDLAENTIVVFASDNGPANTHPTRKTRRTPKEKTT